MKITRSNPKALETLTLRLKELAGIQTAVGWFESAKYEDGTPVALAASVNEFGHGPIPPRPFFRPTITAEKTAWANDAAAGAKAILNGKTTAFNVMDAIGKRAGGRKGNYQPNYFSSAFSNHTRITSHEAQEPRTQNHGQDCRRSGI